MHTVILNSVSVAALLCRPPVSHQSVITGCSKLNREAVLAKETEWPTAWSMVESVVEKCESQIQLRFQESNLSGSQDK